MKTKLSIAGLFLATTQLSEAMEQSDKYESKEGEISQVSRQINQCLVTEYDFELNDDWRVLPQAYLTRQLDTIANQPMSVPFTSALLAARHPNDGPENRIVGVHNCDSEGEVYDKPYSFGYNSTNEERSLRDKFCVPDSNLLTTTQTHDLDLNASDSPDFGEFPSDPTMIFSSKGSRISAPQQGSIGVNDECLPISVYDLSGRKMYFKSKIPDSWLRIDREPTNAEIEAKSKITIELFQKVRQFFIEARLEGITSEMTCDEIWSLLRLHHIRIQADDDQQKGFVLAQYVD